MSALRARAPSWARSDVLLPLFAAYFAFSAFYVWQAWRRETPAIFTDELELTQISRAIAHTGHPARRGVPYHFTSLYPYFTAPAWWLHATQEAFDTIKYLGVLAMTAALFPAYGIARMVLSPRWAIGASIGAIAAPALSYSPILVEEPLAYLASTIALWLIVRAVLRPARGSVAWALAAALLAAAVRPQLVSLVATLVLSLLIVGWRSAPMRGWRTSWNRWDWVGAVALFVGAVIVANAVASSRSQEWEITTRLYKDRIWTYGTWAAAGLAIGLGVLPLLGGIASLVRPSSERATPERTALTIVTACALGVFGWYAALKGAYVSTVLASDIVERNLIYLDPLLFVGMAVLIVKRGTRWWWALASGAFTLYMLAHLPYRPGLDSYPYYEAHGLAMTAFANRIFHWPLGTIRGVVLGIAAASFVVVLLLERLPRRGRAATAAVIGICAVVGAWNVTAETYAANGEYRFSQRFVPSLPRPLDWIDRKTGGASTVLVGQQFADPNGVYLREFWNRSITRVWSVDPTSPAPGPGPTLTPDLSHPDGTMTPAPGTRYALAVNGVALQAPVVAQSPNGPPETLYRLDGRPLHLAFSQTGVESDGWATAPGPDRPAVAAYNRFDAATLGPGFAKISVNRVGGGPAKIKATVTIRVGAIVIGSDKQPAIGPLLQPVRTFLLGTGRSRTVLFKNPNTPFRIEVTISPTFSPHDLDPNHSSDLRHLGAHVGFGFIRV